MCDEHKPWVYNFEMDGKPAYKTSDLVVPHPTKQDLWKMYAHDSKSLIELANSN